MASGWDVCRHLSVDSLSVSIPKDFGDFFFFTDNMETRIFQLDVPPLEVTRNNL